MFQLSGFSLRKISAVNGQIENWQAKEEGRSSSGALFTKRTVVLPQNLSKSRSREIRF